MGDVNFFFSMGLVSDPRTLVANVLDGPQGLTHHGTSSFPSNDDDSGRTFIWSRQVGMAMRLMLSEEVLISTLQSRSTRRGRETVEETA